MKKTFITVEYEPAVFPGAIVRIYEEDVKKVVEEFKEKAIRKKAYTRRSIACTNCGKIFKPTHYYLVENKRIFLCHFCESLIFGGVENARRGKGQSLEG